MSKEILLDVHEMQSPEPMELAMSSLQKLVIGEYCMIFYWKMVSAIRLRVVSLVLISISG